MMNKFIRVISICTALLYINIMFAILLSVAFIFSYITMSIFLDIPDDDAVKILLDAIRGAVTR